MLSLIVGVLCLGWYIGVALVSTFGALLIVRHYRRRPVIAVCERLPLDEVPHITVIRPVKGLEPDLYQCLAATFYQTYPKSKLTVFLCVSSPNDPALPTLEALVHDFREFDVHITIDHEDSILQAKKASGEFGPNPKISNISRAYREAKGDVIWILDCNVWVGQGIAGRLVDQLCGYTGDKPYKFVHQLPLVVDITKTQWQRGLLDQPASSNALASSTISHNDYEDADALTTLLRVGGGRLDETFLTSAHAKWYTAINTVAVAPCILGKSNMFRRSHLNELTGGQGTDYFSFNICEDHLIGDLLWKKPVPQGVAANGLGLEDHEQSKRNSLWGNHGLVFGDVAIQPISSMSVQDYIARRVRWLRVRKFTVTLATLVEPGTETFLCSAYGAYAITTLPWFAQTLSIPPTWSTAVLFWLFSVSMYCAADRALYKFLMSMSSTEVNQDTPGWARGRSRCDFPHWFAGWIGRETLTLPIWLWAVWGGATVVWRGCRYRVGMDMRVTALDSPMLRPNASLEVGSRSSTPYRTNGSSTNKSRKE